jgi:hypothetical protein
MLFSEIWPGPVQKSIIHSIEILINSIEIIEIYFLTGFHDPAIYLNMIFPFKSAIPGTYTPEIGALSVCDIINRSFQSLSSAICYVFQPFKYLNCLRYTKHIATLAEFVLLASKHTFLGNQKFWNCILSQYRNLTSSNSTPSITSFPIPVQ